MELIDIGANLGHESFDHDLDAVLARARAAGVSQLVVTGASRAGSVRSLELARAHPGLLDQVLGPQPTDVSRGNDVLGQIFGSKDVSRAVAQNAASQSGLDPSLLKKMLPMLAMLVTGYMAKQAGGGAASAQQDASAGGLGGLGGGLGGLLGGLLSGGGGASQGAPASGGLASMLDLNGDGNPLDDIMGMIGKVTR